MLSAYLLVKLIHIVSSTLLFGTGLGTAFFMYAAYRSGDARAIAVTTRHVVAADWIFTAPAVIVQFLTGLWLVDYLGIPLSSIWFRSVISTFFLIGLCWLPVVWIQIRVKRIAADDLAGAHRVRCPAELRMLMGRWVALGIPAFVLTVGLFTLMVFKPGLI